MQVRKFHKTPAVALIGCAACASETAPTGEHLDDGAIPGRTVARFATALAVGLLAAAGLAGNASAAGVAWAVNVGGPAYAASDGVEYAADSSVEGGVPGSIEAPIQGTQDPALYQTFRVGDISISKPLEDGTYDVTFHFAEPANVGAGARVFDAFVEGDRVIDDLDVVEFRDGRHHSGLTVTVPDVEIADGELNVRFEPSSGDPFLSALVVREPFVPDEDWQLAWQDEFDGDELDAGKWTPDIWRPRKVNDEDQAYTGREENLRVEDGMLVIEARRESYRGAEYTSARIHSMGKGDFLYGRFEIRAQLPRGQGTWPAIWMLPSDPFFYATNCEEGTDWQGNDDCDAWPNSGEIDIMEHVGYQMNHVHGTVHTRAYYWRVFEQRKGRVLLDDVDQAFHVYAMEWTPERIDIFVDDTLYFSYMNEREGWRAWPFDKPFHLIMNIAVGGYWGRAGGPIDASVFPQRMLIDYVRVYERAE